MSKRLPEAIEKKFKLQLTEKHTGTSFILGSVFYTVKGDENTILTNYDLFVDEEKADPDLSKKGIWLLWRMRFINGRKYNQRVKISEDLLKDPNMFDLEYIFKQMTDPSYED